MYPREDMDPDEQTTETRDEHYDLVSVLYHALHGAETIEAYVLDAEAAGNEQLAGFFREAQATHRQLAERAKGLLGMSSGVAPGAMGSATAGTTPLETEVPPDTAPVDIRGRAAPEVGFPPEGGATSGTAPGDIPPRPADVEREPNVPADEAGVTAEELSSTAAVPRTPPSTTPRPDEDLVAETRGVTPEDVQMETSLERPRAETPPPTEGTVQPRTEEVPLAEKVPSGTPPQAPPGDVQRGSSHESSLETGEIPGEPGRATQEPRAARQMKGEQEEEKGLIDRIKDALTDREEPDRQRDR